MMSVKMLLVIVCMLMGLQSISSMPESIISTDNVTVDAPTAPAAILCLMPTPEKEQVLWRSESIKGQILLTLDNLVCQSVKDCSGQNDSNTEEETVHKNNLLQVELQEGDVLMVHLNLSLNSSSDSEDTQEILLNTVSERDAVTCGQVGQPFTQWKVKPLDSITLKEDLLLAGVHIFILRTKISGSACEVSWTLNVTVRTQECSRLPEDEICSGKGSCLTDNTLTTFTCHCCPGFVGRFCEERDGCYANPCQHGGFCVDITEGLSGSTYQCLCPHGFRGQACEEEVNLCDRKPCTNNGTCRGNQTTYWCDCPAGVTGRHCETNVNECVPSPCVHGLCEDGLSGYKCYCLPGYGGDHCEFEYDECDSSPCINGGACEDLIAGYRCHCGPGYQGRRCQVKVDLCQPNPCPPPAQCVDRGNNYSCICHPGYNGPGCTQHYDPCFPNPCQNGGSCWPSLDSFFCSCKPGYTGDTCEELRYPGMPMAHTQEDISIYRSATIGPVSAPLDHLHNLYIAAATLAGACFIVLGVVSLCHCRVHKTYRRFTRKVSRSSADIKQDQLPRQVFAEVVWERF